MLDAEKCIKLSTKNHKRSKENLSEVVRIKTIVREEFMNVVDKEVNKIWKEGKNRIQNKSEFLAKKYVKEEPEPEVYKGVIVGDKMLEEMEKKQEDKDDNIDRAPIYGGIQGLSKDQEEVLRLPPNHRIFPKMKLEEFKTELEKCVIKANWQKTREQRNQEDINRKDENDDTPTEASKDKTNVIDFRNLKATDLKNNKRIVYPKPDADDEEEIRRNNVKRELEKVFVNYMNENCDKFGNVTENNLPENQVKAIKTLKEKMKDDDLVCFETDKTGKFALDKKENYIKKMRKHIKDDDIVSMTEVKKIEKELNEHAEYLVKITNAGINTNQVKRIKSNLKTSDNQIPILSGTHKDHKEVEDPNIGPDVRPIMGATVGPNVALTDFIARNIVNRRTSEQV